MSEYLDPSHPDAFLDIEKLEPKYGLNFECVKCKGHGKWNLTVNCYPASWSSRHFQMSCSTCHGYGYTMTQMDHAHNWVHQKNLGRCYNRMVCTICGGTWDVDSGD